MPSLQLPYQRDPIAGGLTTPNAWYIFFASLRDFINTSGLDPGVIDSILARLDELEETSLGVFTIQGTVSVSVFGTPESGLVQVLLLNDVIAPGNTYFYGTSTTGAKGWFAVSSAVAGADSIIQTIGADGVSTFNLDGDVLAPGNLFVYATDATGVKGWFRPALFESTGILATAGLAVNAGDPTKFDIGLTMMGMTDYTSNPLQPTRTPRVFPAQTAITVASLAVVATWIGIDVATGAVVQQNTKFTSTQLRSIAQLGAVISNGVQLIAVNNLPSWMRAGINQLGDLLDAIGPMNLSGNVISANGVNLNLNKSAGVEFKQGANAVTNPLDPHKITLAALTALTFHYRLSNGTIFANRTTVDPDNYESPLGTLAPVPAANRFTIQRFSVFTSNLVRAQYGQHVYNTIAEAEAALSTETFATEANIAENGLLLCFLIVRDGATDLSNTADAKFVPASKFGGPVGSGGTSITNTDGLPEGLVNLYFTDARARAAVITSSITNGDTMHSPSGDAVFDALALTQPLDATLTALAGNNWAANALPIGSGADTVAQVAFAANTFPARASTGNLIARPIQDGALSALAGTAGDTLFLRGDGASVNWLNGDLRVGTSSGLFGSGRELVVSAGTTGDNIAHLSLQGSRTTAGATFGAVQFWHQGNRVASFVGFRDGADDAGGIIISTKATGTAIANAVRIDGSGTVRPGADNTQDLGNASTRWMTAHVFNFNQYGARLETGVVSPAQLTANTDNWSVTGLSTAGVIRASTNASRTLTGIASPTAGQTVTLCNVGSNDLVLAHDVTSTAANRFLCPNNTNLTLNQNAAVQLWYDPTSSRWRVIEPITGGGSSVAAVSYLWAENFLKGVLNSPNSGSSFVTDEWRPVSYNSGTAAQTNLAAPGVSMSTGSAVNGLVNLCFTRGTCLAVGWEAQRFGIKFSLPTLSNGTDTFTFQLGLRTVITGTDNNRIIATYTHGTNSGNFTLTASNAGSSTTVNGTAGPVAGTIHTLEIEVNAAGTSVVLYLDDVAITTALATNIPASSTGLAMFALLFKSLGATNRTATIYRGYQKVI